MTVGWNPTQNFVNHYLQNSANWFYVVSLREFVFMMSSRYYTWDDQRSDLQDCTEYLVSLSEKEDMDQQQEKAPSIEFLGTEMRKEYRVSSIKVGAGALHVFEGSADTVQLGPVIDGAEAKDGFLRVVVKASDKRHVAEINAQGQWLSILAVDHTPIVTYVRSPFTGTSRDELRFGKSEYSKRLLEVDVKVDRLQGRIEFVPVGAGDVLVSVQRLKHDDEVFLLVQERFQNVVKPELVELAAIIVFWSELMPESGMKFPK
jgi:hypothetical protein